jgi:hypothetical protein
MTSGNASQPYRIAKASTLELTAALATVAHLEQQQATMISTSLRQSEKIVSLKRRFRILDARLDRLEREQESSRPPQNMNVATKMPDHGLLSDDHEADEACGHPSSDFSWHLDENEESQLVIVHDEKYYASLYQKTQDNDGNQEWVFPRHYPQILTQVLRRAPEEDDSASTVSSNEEATQEPYIMSLESQIERSIIGDQAVVGRPPGVNPRDWEVTKASYNKYT